MKFSHSTLVAVLASLVFVASCGGAEPEPASSDEAIAQATSELTDVQILLRELAPDEILVVYTADDAGVDVTGLLVLDQQRPWALRLSSQMAAAAPPATLAFAGNDRNTYIYGRILDPRIVQLEVSLPGGALVRRPVSSPAYAIAIPEADAYPQSSTFFDANGTIVK